MCRAARSQPGQDAVLECRQCLDAHAGHAGEASERSPEGAAPTGMLDDSEVDASNHLAVVLPFKVGALVSRVKFKKRRAMKQTTKGKAGTMARKRVFE